MTSDMSLSYPAMMMGVICDTCAEWMRMPRKRRKSPATREEPNIRLIVHPNSELLSHNRAAWVFASLDVRHSSTSQLRTSPAISI